MRTTGRSRQSSGYHESSSAESVAPGKRTATQSLPSRQQDEAGTAAGSPSTTFAPQPGQRYVDELLGSHKAGDWVADAGLLSAMGLGAPAAGSQGTSQPVQMLGAGGGAERAQAAAAHGISGASARLPFLDQIQASFGSEHDVSQVQSHIGGPAAEGSAAMGAQAYATGNHVAFASAPDLHTAAHEAAHVVQQRSGVSLKGGVGQSGDSYEQHADAVADKVVKGEPAGELLNDKPAGASAPAMASPMALQRKARGAVTTDDSEVVVRSIPAVVQQAKAEDVAGGDGVAIRPGQAGYARAMLAATGGRAERMSHNYKDSLVRNLAPSLGGIDEFTRQRAAEKQKFMEESEPGFWGGAPTARALWAKAGTWCQERINEAEEDRASEQEQFSRYNAWVPRANGFFTSLERLQAQSFMIGHRNDTESLAAALVQGLEEAERVAHRAQASFDGGKAAALPPLPSDDSVVNLSNATMQAARELNTAYIAYQVLTIQKRGESINKEGNEDRERLDKINEVKAFVQQVGATIDSTMSHIQGAPASIANATELVQRTGAQINASRNRGAVMNGQRPTHNPTYLTTDEKGNMVVRNMQMGEDTSWNDKGEKEKSPMPSSGFSMPSIGGALSAIADFAYASEVKELMTRLEQVKSRMEGANVAAEFVKERQLIQALQDRVMAFSLACRNLQQRMAERRQQYLTYGVALDNFARGDSASKQAGGPGAGADRFATIMTVTSAVRETLAVGQGARREFMTEGQIAAWARRINERRSRSDCPMRLPNHEGRVKEFECTEEEWAQMSSMWSQVQGFGEYVDQISGDLAPVEARAKLMMGAPSQIDGQQHGLHQGGGSGDY